MGCTSSTKFHTCECIVIDGIYYYQNHVEIGVVMKINGILKERVIELSKMGKWKSFLRILKFNYKDTLKNKSHDRFKEDRMSYISKLWNKSYKLHTFIYDIWNFEGESSRIYIKYKLYALNSNFVTKSLEKKYADKLQGY